MTNPTLNRGKIALDRLSNFGTETWSVLGTCLLTAIGAAIAIHSIEIVATVALMAIGIFFIAFNNKRAIELAAVQVGLVDKANVEKEKLREEFAELGAELELAKCDYAQLEAHFVESDRAFRQLATHRMNLDTQFFLLMRRPDAERGRAMAEAITGYFNQVCNHIVDIVSARLVIDKDDLAVDIKIVSDNGRMYRAVARSAPHSLVARERMTERSHKDKNKRELVSNLHLKLAAESNRHENLIDDLAEWRKLHLHRYFPKGNVTAPPEAAMNFYRTSLTVAMFIEKTEEDSDMIGDYGREAKVNYIQERVYGFISIDSLKDIRFTDLEKSILHEVSVNTLSVIRLYDILGDIENTLFDH
jgi:hypothetical protein